MGEPILHPTSMARAQDRVALHTMLADLSDQVELDKDPVVGIAMGYVYRSGTVGHCTTIGLGGNFNALLGAIGRLQAHLALRCCALPCQDRTTPSPTTAT